MGAKAFKAYDGGYLIAEEGHIHVLPELTDKGHFHVEEHDDGKKVSIKTHNGRYIAVNCNHEIYLRHDHHNDEAKFHLENHHGKVALKSHHGGYLGVHDGRLSVHHERTEHELFQEINL